MRSKPLVVGGLVAFFSPLLVMLSLAFMGGGSKTDCVQYVGATGGSNNTQIAFNYLMRPEFQLKPFQAAAIVGNFIHESASDPISTDAVSPIGAYGIAQWYAGRLTGLRNHPFQGLPVNDINRQLDFLRTELLSYESGSLKALQSTNTIENATIVFENKFEVSGVVSSYPARIEHAKSVLARYGNTVDTHPSAVAAGCYGLSGAGNGSLDAVLKKITEYAEPTYHLAPYIHFLPAYQNAINRAIANGEYVGGDTHPGVDCGGFVSRVMRDSGFDKQYNRYNGTTSFQKLYMDQNPQKYQPLGTYGSMAELKAKARPGDIAINDHHTYIYVGDVLGPNWHGDSASASVYSWRSPMASNAYLGSTPRSGGYYPFYWYRPVYR